MANEASRTSIDRELALVGKALAQEFEGIADEASICDLLSESAARVARGARLQKYVPLLAYRGTREQLSAMRCASQAQTSDSVRSP